MHNLSDVEGIFSYRMLPVVIYFNSLFPPTYETCMENNRGLVGGSSKIENPHSINNYLPHQSSDIVQVFLIIPPALMPRDI